MIKAAKALQLPYPTLPHALHRVAEEVRRRYPEVDQLIENGKKIFIKSSLRMQNFKEEVKVEGKATPLQAWTGPQGSRRLRLPDFNPYAQAAFTPRKHSC
jgi:hypothetical protein